MSDRALHPGPLLARLICAGAAFLMAVLWMDLMFDVQALGGDAGTPLPEVVLASSAAYYRRVTIDASPMGRVVGIVMLLTLLATLAQALRVRGPAWLRWSPVLFMAIGLSLAFASALPNAIALGTRAGSVMEQSVLARSILHAHIVCLASMIALLGFELLGFRRTPGPAQR